jgi:MarR family transcriptional regulator, organic hydroperoxide resistance regulator
MTTRTKTIKAVAKRSGARPRQPQTSLPLASSVGYQIRMTHRLLQRYLQLQIEPYGITLGMWYFLRALWDEDGITQRELSKRIGTMEPTTLSAIQAMLRADLVRRVRDKTDRRKLHIFLTPKSRGLKAQLLPLARDVVATALLDLSPADNQEILRLLRTIQRNLTAKLGVLSESDEGWTAKRKATTGRSSRTAVR